MSKTPYLYVYPRRHVVSFTLIAEKHVEYMRGLGAKVYTMDELQIVGFVPGTRYKLILHPTFFIMDKILRSCTTLHGVHREEYYDWWKQSWDEVVGIDVCDSDAYSPLAVYMANKLDKFVLPSKFCVDVAKKSGVKARVYWVPHGVDPEWYTMPNVWETTPVKTLNPTLVQLYLYKVRRNVRFLLFFLWHSAERKGWPEVFELYRRLRRERRDVVLVMKTASPNTPEYMQVMGLGAVNVYGWLSDYEKMALYDLADITLLFSRGGSFELNCLESIVRGTPCISSDWGPWTEYVPPWLQVKRGRRVQPLPGNAIHVGYGYTVDVDKALDRVLEVLDNLEEYRAKTLEWARERLYSVYRWDVVAAKLIQALES